MSFRMTPLFRSIAACALFLGTMRAAKVPIDISEIATRPWTIFDRGELLPAGPQQFNGVPFLISSGEGNAWIGFGTGVQSATVDINVEGATTVYTLINTVWGQSGFSTLSLTFEGSAGATFTKELRGNFDIRDFLSPTEFTDRINNTTTINAWMGPPSDEGELHRLDQQIIELPPAFATQTLTSMTITDRGQDGSQRGILSALTIDGVKPHRITGGCDAAGCQELISPGAIVSFFGLFAQQTAAPSSVPLLSNLDGFSITFNDEPGAIFGVFLLDDFGTATDQANVQVPWNIDVSSGTVEVKVHWEDESGAVWSEPFVANAALASPGIFVFGGTKAIVTNFSTGNDDVIAGSWAQPDGSIQGVDTQAAAVGGVITVWCGGLGPVTETPETGDIPMGTLPETTKTVRLLIDGIEATIIGKPVLHPTSVGLNQINAFVPEGVEPGDEVPIVIEVECDDGTILSNQANATIAVRPAP